MKRNNQNHFRQPLNRSIVCARSFFKVAVLIAVFLLLLPGQIVKASETSATTPATAPVTTQSLPLPTAVNPAADLTSDAVNWRDPSSLSAAAWPSLEQVTAKVKAYVVIDRLSGASILAYNESTPQFPASTTKIMTAVLALENLSLDQTITATKTAVDLPWDASKAGFQVGETVTVLDVLAGLMLPSGNDAANMLAEAIGGDLASFAIQMTVRAQEMGARNSNFINSNGLHDDLHQMSAADLAIITTQAMRYPAFRELIDTPTYAMAATNIHPQNGWAIYSNSNARLLLQDQANYRVSNLAEISGVKTGSTKAAGNCLVTAATTTSGQELICVLFGVDPEDLEGNVVSYTRTLLEAAAQKTAGQPESLETYFAPSIELEIPDSDYLAVPIRSLVVQAQDASNLADLTWQWPQPDMLAELAETETLVELPIYQGEYPVLSIPIQIKKQPNPLTGLISSSTDAESTGTPSLWDWPGFIPFLITLGIIIMIVVIFNIGLSIGRRQGYRAAKFRESFRK